MIKPSKVNILGMTYTITYVNKPSDVDIRGRESLWGQIDFWTRTIRICDAGRTKEDMFQTLIHEVLHGIACDLHLALNKEERHDELDLLALAFADVLVRNSWVEKGESK